MILRTTALGVACAALLFTAPATQAADSQTETKVADAGSQVHVAASVDRDDDATCSRSRRRLWIEGEGWVVRRITTCR